MEGRVQQRYNFPNRRGEAFIMDAEALQAFLAKPHEAIVATNRVGKGPQLSPVWFLWDGEAFLFGTQKRVLNMLISCVIPASL
jgi:nitroimidazol reductase NimA-like FMN-containing flavoprotein (pyridoxamine 5'-phosphate oxidase superfamily)